MKIMLNEIWYTALFELQVSIRSRRAFVVAALFTIASVGSALIFVNIIDVAENALAEQLMVPKTKKIGLMIDKLKDNETFQYTLGEFIGNQYIVKEIMDMPVMAINYTWFVLTFIPFAIAYICSETFSREVSSGSIRFVLFRTDLFYWIMGKVLGQVLLILVALLFSMLAMVIVGIIKLYNFEIFTNLYWMLIMSLRIAFYAYAFLGFVLMISMMFRNVGTARALSLILISIMLILDPILSYGLMDQYPLTSHSLLQILPSHHQQSLWYPNIQLHSIAQLILFSIGSSYLFVGYQIFMKKEK
jgi:ABC-type transport system involved in multi-copper enzyme maturation permease subunit